MYLINNNDLSFKTGFSYNQLDALIPKDQTQAKTGKDFIEAPMWL